MRRAAREAKCVQIHSAVLQPNMEAAAQRARAQSTLRIFLLNSRRGRRGRRTGPDNTRKFILPVDTNAQATALGNTAREII